MTHGQRLGRRRPSGKLTDDGFEFTEDMAYLGIKSFPSGVRWLPRLERSMRWTPRSSSSFVHLSAEGRLSDVSRLSSGCKVTVFTVNDKIPQLLYRWQFHVTPPLEKGLRIRASCRGASPCVILTAIQNEETVPSFMPGQYLLNRYSEKSSSKAALAASNSSSVGAT